MRPRTPVPPIGPADAPPLPEPTLDDAGRVVWRTWRVVPDPNDDRPLLTGLFGFPWPEQQVDAKCVQEDRAVDGFGMKRRMDRYHRVVPAEGCTCGIYAGRDELTQPRVPKPPRARPYVTGFVELGGRIVAEPDVFRAQQATIVGPLTIWVGRPPIGAVLLATMGRSMLPQRILTAPNEYRVLWSAGRIGTPLGRWLDETAEALQSRYRVEVVAPSV